MAKFKNSFALLDDEEGDDVSTLVDRIVKKVDDSVLHAQNETDSSKEFVKDESGPRRGGQGRRGGRGSRRNGYDGSNDVQGGYAPNNHARNSSRDSYGSGDVNKDYGQWSGNDGDGWNYVNEAAGNHNYQSGNNGYGWQDFPESHGRGDGNYSGRRRGYGLEVQHSDATDAQRRYRNRNGSFDGNRRVDGDQAQSHVAADGHGRYRNGNRSHDGDRRGRDGVQDNHTADGQRRYRTGSQGQGNRRGDGHQSQNNDASYGYGDANRTNDGERIGSGGQIQDNDGADRQRRYRNRNQSYDGQRRGYEGQTPNNAAVDGHGKYRNENWSYDGVRRGTEDRVQSNDSGYGHSRHRNGRQSYGGERNYYEDQARDNNVKGEVNEDNRFRGEQRTYRNGNRYYESGRGCGGYNGKGKQDYQTGEVEETGNATGGLDGSNAALVPEDSGAQKKQEELELKRKQFEELQRKKEEEEAEEAKLMTLAEYEKLLSEKKQALESCKTRERKVAIDKDLEGMRLVKKQDDLDDKLKSEEKLQKKGNTEKKEKGSKLEVHDLFKPAYRRRSNGRGGYGHGDQGGLNDQTVPAHYYNGPQRNGNASRARTQHRGQPAVPTDKDFPVLCASGSAAAASASTSAVKR